MRRLSSSELTFWLAYYRRFAQDPGREDFRFATLAANTANANPHRAKPAQLDDFLWDAARRRARDEEREWTPEEEEADNREQVRYGRQLGGGQDEGDDE